MAGKVTMYTKTYCHYCKMAASLMKERGIPFQEVNIETWESEKIQALFEKSGMRTVPQIFFGEELIGGYTDLAARDEKDKLAFMKT